ncbi:glycine--tRNA ligase [Candidatus Woesearchaeota archaeon]|nr:glycine--tRNA ligase [Candidatus Woesearchaeota archaeon]
MAEKNNEEKKAEASEAKLSLNVEEMAAYCKRRGFVYPSGEIYGSISGFFDFGSLGVELKNNIKNSWWKTFVQSREDVVGIDGAIITHSNVWKASGHVDCFADIILQCSSGKCKEKVRADTFIEEELGETSGTNLAGVKAAEINKIVAENNLVCPKCKSSFEDANDFNLMFETQVGPSKDKKNTAYLRPETAQIIFTDFKLVMDNARAKLPFGIAQIGKAFRNEISPRDFLFRSREFEQMEIEFFVHPQKINECPDNIFNEVKDLKANVLTTYLQEKNEKNNADMPAEVMSFGIIGSKLTSKWHAYWLGVMYKWFLDLGIKPENLRIRQHKKEELAHYAGACFDIEYNFPFGWKEIHGNADRTTFDLTQHIKVSQKDVAVYDEESKQKVIPYVAAEPSQGVERAMLAFLFDAYNYDKSRENVVLRLHPMLAPVKIGVFPLVNKLDEEARKVYDLLKKDFVCLYDRSGTVGKRYARNDEAGTPFCVTVDFDGVNDKTVTVRDRDTTKQIRVKVSDLKEVLGKLLAKEIEFEKAGKLLN